MIIKGLALHQELGLFNSLYFTEDSLRSLITEDGKLKDVTYASYKGGWYEILRAWVEPGRGLMLSIDLSECARKTTLPQPFSLKEIDGDAPIDLEPGKEKDVSRKV